MLCLVPLVGAAIGIINPEIGIILFALGMMGIGLWLLRLDAFERGESARIFLPDTPFREWPH